MEHQDSAKSTSEKKKRKKMQPSTFWVLQDVPQKSWGEINRYIRKNGRMEMHLPQWMEKADEWTEVSPARFLELRKLMLNIKAVQCAAFLRVSVSTVWRWESGEVPVPFAAYMALRLLLDVRYLPHQVKAWEGWQIINAGPDVGMLYDSQKTGVMVTPTDIRAARYVKAERNAWQRKAEEAEAKAAALETENTRLRHLFNGQGVTAELRQMQDRLAAVLSSIGTAEIIDYTPASAGIRREKAA
jgi:DNA-binding transcriptional regulator YiaG